VSFADQVAQAIAGKHGGATVQNAGEFLTMLGLTMFAGFFAAMAIVNVTTALILRSVASAAYAALMTVMVAIMLYSIHDAFLGGALVHAILIASYLACTVLFAFALLRSWRYDRLMAWIVTGTLAFNLPLVFLEDLAGKAWSPFYPLDQAAFDVLLVALIVLGFRALAHEGVPVAGAYLAAFFLPAVGNVLDDLAAHDVIARQFQLSFEFAVAWEAMFFAFAVAMRNRGVQSERDRYERLSRIDGLTGIANRRTFDEELERMWTVARRARVPIAVAMIDIDFFKALNDRLGHQAGDDCLRRVASLCAGTLRRAGDCFARYGGEEFGAILFNADLRAAEALASRVREAVEADGEVTISIGVAAIVPRSGGGAEALVAAADAALYRAKESGRNCVVASDEINTLDDPDSARPPDLRLGTP
jgi:diguanylate cyclase (GGDEF)-like protein